MSNIYNKLAYIGDPNSNRAYGSNNPLPITIQSQSSSAVTVDFGHTDNTGNNIFVEPQHIEDFNFTFDENEFIQKSGTYQHEPNSSTLLLTASGGNTSFAANRYYSIYQPGNTMVAQMTGTMSVDGNSQSFTSRMGYFNNYNGHFLQYSPESGFSLVERSYSSGSVVDNSVSKESWNVNSDISLNPGTITLMQISALWQGTGDVRICFLDEGSMKLAHVFQHSNALTVPYTTNYNLQLDMRLLEMMGTRIVCVQYVVLPMH